MASLHVTAGRLCSIASPLPLRAANRLLTRHGQRPFSTTPVAPASHASQGVANGPKNGAGKRLGAKKYGGEWVVPGVIIYRQRGSKWFPGENCDMGRDHTIFATQKGYVRYYRDPALHPKRSYIGVAIAKDHALPTPLNAARRRRLDMYAAPRPAETPEERGEPFAPGLDDVFGIARDGSKLKMNRDYSFVQANRLIGRAAEMAGVTVRPFKNNDRWLAWRKRAARAKRLEGTRALKVSAKGGRKSKQKKRQ